MNKLNFVIAGFQKCGSSALADYLARHPEVNFCKTKEPAFFSKEFTPPQEENYFKLYKIGEGLKGEASTAYAFPENLPQTAQRLHQHNTDLKIILLVRNPLKRIESAMNHALLNNQPEKASVFNNKNLIERTRYGFVYNQYLNYFPKQNIIILKFEDITSGEKLKDICDFLGIHYYPDINFKKVNYTNKRYRKLFLWRLYHKYWSFFNKINLNKNLKLKVKATIDKLFSQKLEANKKKTLSAEEKDFIIQKLERDSQMFKQHTGFDYFNLIS